MEKIFTDKLQVSAVQQALIKWYRTHHRELPWRETGDAYSIWISEIMLQQTQVETVKAYYHRFLEQLPTVHHLASAEPGQVMKLWEGLGYYSRARHLHAAAKIVSERHNGILPDSYEDLTALPGIGRYTAGAILSIAYGQSVPVLDGNVMRILTRIYHITDCIDRSATQTLLWRVAELHLNAVDPSEINQAMMELCVDLQAAISFLSLLPSAEMLWGQCPEPSD